MLFSSKIAYNSFYTHHSNMLNSKTLNTSILRSIKIFNEVRFLNIFKQIYKLFYSKQNIFKNIIPTTCRPTDSSLFATICPKCACITMLFLYPCAPTNLESIANQYHALTSALQNYDANCESQLFC